MNIICNKISSVIWLYLVNYFRIYLIFKSITDRNGIFTHWAHLAQFSQILQLHCPSAKLHHPRQNTSLCTCLAMQFDSDNCLNFFLLFSTLLGFWRVPYMNRDKISRKLRNLPYRSVPYKDLYCRTKPAYCPHSFVFHFQGSKTVKQNWAMKHNWVGWNKIERTGFYDIFLLFEVLKIKI